jgi:polyhydroxyalkanoate synthesis regulator phasin
LTATEIDSLRSWVAELDRKLGLRTYLTLAAALLALACSIVAVVLAVDARDNSASSDDITSLEEQVAALEAATAAAAAAPAEGGGSAGSAALEERVTTLESQVKGLAEARDASDSRVAVIEDDIDDLRSQISDLNGGG